ncbi:hypothetical protein SELMODRAFT_422029 [Selaginella moellendorffii]|uniref:Uncharacterized protein n=1 Tax=Selaginella moellendorffii TaxID=88036 RepID=D8SH45_SELML|nr:hypothetical protein SELMODRAFT_422029 [Selaginella moellendorffii]
MMSQVLLLLLLLCVSTFSASGSASEGYSQPEKPGMHPKRSSTVNISSGKASSITSVLMSGSIAPMANSSQPSSLVHGMVVEFKGHQLDHMSALANNSAIRARRINVGQQTFAGIIDAALSQKLSPSMIPRSNPVIK